MNKFFAEYLNYSSVNHSPGTFERYKIVIDNFKTFLENQPYITRVSHLNPKLFEDYKAHRKKQGVKTNTINIELTTLRTVFNRGIAWGKIEKNPTQGVNTLKVTDEKKPRFLTKEECKKLLDNCGEKLYPIFYTFLKTGMRKGELLNLEWNDIDFNRRKIKIRAKEQWHPKTSEREMPISNSLLSLLTELKKKRRKDTDLVFHNGDGKLIPKNKLRKQLMRITKKCGFPDVTKLHSLRHTFASQLVMAGVDLPTVKKLMGHANIETTMIYAHLAPDHLVDAVDKLDL